MLSPMMIDLQQLGIEIGSGAVIGALIGFTAKKVAKILAVIVGLQLALFKFLESRQVLVVNWERLGAAANKTSGTATAQAPPSWLMSIVSTMGVGAGFAGGFFAGFKKA